MVRSTWFRSVGAAILVGLSLVALAASGFFGGAASAAGAPTNVTLTLGIQAQNNWWFPDWTGQYCGVTNSQIFDMAYRPLLYVGGNDAIDYGQSIATGVSVNPQDTVFTVHVGQRFKWSNGQTVSAYDALYDAQILLAATAKNAPFTDCGLGIGGLPTDWKSVTAPNARTLVVTTTKPVNPVWFEENGIAQIYPVPKSVWDHSANWTTELKWILSVGVKSTSPQFKVIDGPYAYGKFVYDAYETLVANPHYTGPDPAHIKTLTFLYETSEPNLWAAALRRTFAEVGIPSQYNSQRSELEREAGYRTTPAPYGYCFNYAVPNLNSQNPTAPLLRQTYIRQALEMALNQAAMIRLAGGIGFPIYGPVPPVPSTVWYTPAVGKHAIAFNPAKGKKLLMAHGWTMKHGVMTNAKGQTLTFTLTYISGIQWVTNSVELWQHALAQEGIQLKLAPNLETGTIAFTTHKWQIAWWGGGWCYGPDYYPTGYGLFVPGSTANPGDFNSPSLTKLVLATHAPSTPAQARARMFAYEIAAAEQLPVFYMPEVGGYDAVQPWVHIPAQAWNPVLGGGLQQYNMWYTTAP